MKNRVYVSVAIISLIVGFLLLKYGIDNQGVMISIVGVTLILQATSILITPFFKGSEHMERKFEKDFIIKYALVLESLIRQKFNAIFLYTPSDDNVKIVVVSKVRKNGYKIRMISNNSGQKVMLNLESKINFPPGENDTQSFILKLEKKLREENLVEELKYFKNKDYEILLIKNPTMISFSKQLNDIAPKTYRIFGCPLSAALVSLIAKYRKTALIANFRLNGNTVVVKFRPAKAEIIRVTPYEI